MRILFISDYFSTWDMGGASRVLWGQLEGLKELNLSGLELELISGYPGDDKKENLNDMVWHRLAYKCHNFSFRLSLLIRKVLKENPPDIIHFHQPLSAFLALPWLDARTPKLYHFHSYWLDEKVAHSDGSMKDRLILRIKGAIERYSLRRMDQAVVLSDYSKMRLQETLPSHIPITRLAGAVRCSDFFTPNQPKDTETLNFLSVRRLEPRMGLDVLIRAFAAFCKKSAKPTTLTLVGAGRMEQELKTLAQTCGVENKVIFAGRLSHAELLKAYTKAHVSIVPSLKLEGFGMVVIESFCAGVPVLASSVGGLSTFLAHKDCFYALEQLSVESLEQGLQWVSQNFCNKLVRDACLKTALEHYDLSLASRKLFSLYRSLLS